MIRIDSLSGYLYMYNYVGSQENRFFGTNISINDLAYNYSKNMFVCPSVYPCVGSKVN